MSVINAKYPGKCAVCNGQFGKGEMIGYDAETRKATHAYCFEESPTLINQAEALATRLGFIPTGAPIPFDEWRRWKQPEEPRQQNLGI